MIAHRQDEGAETRQMKLRELFNGWDLPENFPRCSVNGLSLDSRTVQQGQAFCALKGTKLDARSYVGDAIDRGAVAIIQEADANAKKDVEIQTPVEDRTSDIPVVLVKNLPERLSGIAGQFYHHASARLRLIGVTGTNGKSTCVSLLSQLLHELGEEAAYLGTLGYAINDEWPISTGLTTPDAIACQRILDELNSKGARSVAMEVSSHGMHQHRVSALRFDTAIFTNLSRDHLDYHASIEDYRDAKATLFQMPGLKTCIVNVDDEHGRWIADNIVGDSVRLVTYGMENRDASVSVYSVSYSGNRITAHIKTPWGTGVVRSELIGNFNLYNLLAVISCACTGGHRLQSVLEACKQLHAVPGRLELVKAEGSVPYVYVDYAHTPDALEKALKVLREQEFSKLIVVFGCGGDRDKGKRSIMGQVAENHADQVVLTSDNPRTEAPEQILEDIAAGITKRDRVTIIADRAEAIKFAIENANNNACVLVAGKGHENYQILGSKVIDFSDVEVARKVLNSVSERRSKVFQREGVQ